MRLTINKIGGVSTIIGRYLSQLLKQIRLKYMMAGLFKALYDNDRVSPLKWGVHGRNGF
jgi:hypothetical protein